MSETRRDRWGRYLVLPPGATKPIGYTRVTTIAKTLDDGGGLLPWKATATVVGALRRPGLLARWQQLLTEHPDPWYSSDESKATAKKLVEDCALAGGSADRAEIGTALHAMVEARLRGGFDMVNLQPSMLADLEAFHAATNRAGLVFDARYIEATVVLDDHKVAGTADQLAVSVPGYGLMVGDLKTGANLDYSWQAIAVQLAAYANASAVYRQGDATDGSDDTRDSMPAISRTHGLVIHLPAGEARCELHIIDLAAGWDAFQLAMQVRAWRSNKKLVVGYQPPSGTTTTPTPAEQVDAIKARSADIDEGNAVDDYTALQRRYERLDQPSRDWIKRLAVEATQGGVPFNLSAAKTVRRFEILRALVLICEAQFDPPADADIRQMLEPITGIPADHDFVPIGALVGSLSATEAARFAGLADGTFALAFTDEGRPTLAPAA